MVGQSFFIDLVEDFYARVDVDPVLRPSYPDDLAESKRTLAWFLIQYWGGPTDYSDERGHPRLRMRHAPFVIGQAERDAWHRHMTAAVAASSAPDEVKALLDNYFEHASTAMINNAR
ncbi:MAG: globin [Actinomycetota bacterium]